jgi:hypothetical protein
LLDKDILNKIDEVGYSEMMTKYQNRFLKKLLNTKTLKSLIDAEVVQKNNYAAIDMVGDLRRGIFFETRIVKNVDLHRRNLQKSFINRMSSLMKDASIENTDIPSIVRGELTTLKYLLNSASKRAVNKITKYHYKDSGILINNILNPK